MTRVVGYAVNFACKATRIFMRESRVASRHTSSSLLRAENAEDNSCIVQTEKPKVLPKHNYSIRTATVGDMPEIKKIRQSLGSHDVPSVFETFFKLDPEGNRVAVNEQGKVIGFCCSVLDSDERNGLYFGGVWCVLPEFKGAGIGGKLYRLCVSRPGNVNLGGNSVPSLLHLYKEHGGFPIEEENWMPVKNYTPNYVSPEVLLNVIPPGVEVQPFQDSFLPEMVAYDQALVGYRRSKLLSMSCHEMNCKTFVAFKNGVCVGFGSIKETCLGAGRVGPLYADDPAIAEVILRKLLESFPDRNGFAMMTVSSNTQASSILKKLDCPVREKCHRVYTKHTVDVDTSKIYALFDMNFTVF